MSDEPLWLKLLGWFGTVMAIAGAMLVASNTAFSAYGYIAFTLSSISLVVWSTQHRVQHQMLMNGAFLLINLTGVYRWLIA